MAYVQDDKIMELRNIESVVGEGHCDVVSVVTDKATYAAGEVVHITAAFKNIGATDTLKIDVGLFDPDTSATIDYGTASQEIPAGASFTAEGGLQIPTNYAKPTIKIGAIGYHLE